ncbi:hypothetical protein BC835DRAFT_1341517 [Cytidiella melzeri]|nr:hypothetical protein BC835DRAFT_1341517 [Cytidiella melzeri]
MSTNTASSAGASAGQKVKGAFQAVHGIGESIRGNAMDFVDSATGTERRGHGATVNGQRETEIGVSNMEQRQPNAAATRSTATPTSTAQTAVPAGSATGPASTVTGGTGYARANAL